MAAAFPNIYTHRKVAETASKACDICYKSSTSVLITPDKKVRYSSYITSTDWVDRMPRTSSTSVLYT